VIVGATLGMSTTITHNREYYKEVYERCTSVDLIYLDPPFNSNADYFVVFKEGRREDR
jgi:16S rRNA G966 N2-methylase RsmD